jgi:hypothetical protein
LADDETYQQLVASLPEERGLTLYADQARAPEMSRLLARAAPLAIGPLDLTSLVLPPGAVGVSIVDQGLRLDTAAPQGDTDAEQAPRQMAALFPAATLVFVSGDTLDGVWTSLKGSLAAAGTLGDFEESMALLSREFGYDPDQQLFPVLDGEWTLAVLPAGEGLVNELTGWPLGLVLLAGSEDVGALAATVDDLNQSLEGQRLPLATADVGGAQATFIDLESLIGAPLPLYGIEEDYLFLGTDAQILAEVLDGQGVLSESEDYQAAVKLLPEGYKPGAYVDLAGLLAQMADGANGEDYDPSMALSTALLDPVRHVVAGSGPAAGGVRPGVVFIIIE